MLRCGHCGKQCRSKAGLTNHFRSDHHDEILSRYKRKQNSKEFPLEQRTVRQKHDDGTFGISFLQKKDAPIFNDNDMNNQFSKDEEEFNVPSHNYVANNTSNITENQDIFDPARKPSLDSDNAYRKEVGMPNCTMFQIDLLDILKKRRVDLGLHDELVELITEYSSGSELQFDSANLHNRQTLLKNLEQSFMSENLRPTDIDVELTNGTHVTISTFDLEAQILSLIEDDEIMSKENIAPNYDIFSGRSTMTETSYGEIHTGDAWMPARDRYCGNESENMPLALIIFADKSHYDRHGGLSTTPLVFTLSCFNKEARNRPDFWRPLAYIPNLSYGSTSDKSTPKEQTANVQDEHTCLQAAFSSLVDVVLKGGISTNIKGKKVIGKVWIHYIIGDTAGNNHFVGQYNSSGKCSMPYRDCHCTFEDLALSNPTCKYISEKVFESAKQKQKSASFKTAGHDFMKNISKHPINNAFMDIGIPLSDLEHGIFRMLPPERMHTTDEGITKHSISALASMIGDNVRGKEVKYTVDNVHHSIQKTLSRNSERDFPRTANRTGFLQNTLVNANERRGNLFIFLCILHTSVIEQILIEKLREKILQFLA